MADSLTSLRQRAMLLLGAGVLIAGLTAGAAFEVISGFQAELVSARQPRGEAAVLAATRDLPVGTVIAATDLTPSHAPVAAGIETHTTTDPTALLGLVVVSPVLAGEPVRLERVAASVPAALLSEGVAMGRRAMTVEVTRAAGVGGLLRRGDHVDIIVTIRPDDHAVAAAWVTDTILQGIKVLDTGAPDPLPPTTVDGKEAPKSAPVPAPRQAWITVEVTPEEAERLAMAAARGEIEVTLRGRDDIETIPDAAPLVTNEMVGLHPKPLPPARRAHDAPPAADPGAEVIQGADRAMQTFPRSVTVASP